MGRQLRLRPPGSALAERGTRLARTPAESPAGLRPPSAARDRVRLPDGGLAFHAQIPRAPSDACRFCRPPCLRQWLDAGQDALCVDVEVLAGRPIPQPARGQHDLPGAAQDSAEKGIQEITLRDSARVCALTRTLCRGTRSRGVYQALQRTPLRPGVGAGDAITNLASRNRERRPTQG